MRSFHQVVVESADRPGELRVRSEVDRELREHRRRVCPVVVVLVLARLLPKFRHFRAARPHYRSGVGAGGLGGSSRFRRFASGDVKCIRRSTRSARAISRRARLYEPSLRQYHGLSDLEYPFHDRTVTVTTCGRICLGRRKINLSIVFAGQNVGAKEVSDKIWLVTFMKYHFRLFRSRG